MARVGQATHRNVPFNGAAMTVTGIITAVDEHGTATDIRWDTVHISQYLDFDFFNGKTMTQLAADLLETVDAIPDDIEEPTLEISYGEEHFEVNYVWKRPIMEIELAAIRDHDIDQAQRSHRTTVSTIRSLCKQHPEIFEQIYREAHDADDHHLGDDVSPPVKVYVDAVAEDPGPAVVVDSDSVPAYGAPVFFGGENIRSI